MTAVARGNQASGTPESDDLGGAVESGPETEETSQVSEASAETIRGRTGETTLATQAEPTSRLPTGWLQRKAPSLLHRNYRLYFFGQLVSVIGTWMQTIAQSFLVLELTHSGTELGLTTAVRFLPMLLFGPAGGLYADRHDKRRILYLTQTLSGLLAGVFAICLVTGSMHLWVIYLLAAALGFVNVFDNPARQSFISEMVPPADMPNAVLLNSISMNMARVFGAAVGGTVAAVLGLTLCFTLNAVSYIAVLVSLAAMSAAALYPARKIAKEKGQVRAGLRYVWSKPEILIPMVMIAVVGTLAWEFQVSLPLMASSVFHGWIFHNSAAAYGTMASVMGAGAVVGGFVSAGRVQPGPRALCLASIGWGIAILAAALAPNMPVELAAMLFVGYGSITFNSLAKTTLQLAAKPEMRGRVMALWALAWLGSTPIGGPIVGWVGENAGPRWGLIIGGVATLACGILALGWAVRRGAVVAGADASDSAHERGREQAREQARERGRQGGRERGKEPSASAGAIG
jgi:MFS family permease